MRRAFRRGFVGGKPAGELRRAHALLERGEYPAAAQAFEQLAAAAENRGGPRAPMLHLQAGRAWLRSGQAAQALAELQKGLEILAERGRWARFQRAGQRSTAELRQLGFAEQAGQLTSFLEARLPKGFDLAMAPSLSQRPPLPPRCPSCGAVVEPDEVEWIDDITAECDYCGSPLRAQK